MIDQQTKDKDFKTIEVNPTDIVGSNHEGGNPWNQDDTWPGSSTTPFVAEDKSNNFKTIEVTASDIGGSDSGGGNPWNQNDTWPGSSATSDDAES